MSRSFRRGLRVGLLVGIAFAVVKMVQSRRSTLAPDDGPDPWAERSLPPEPVLRADPEPLVVPVRDEPVAPARLPEEPSVPPAGAEVTVDELEGTLRAEPAVAPEPPPRPPAKKRAPAKKAAAKKAPPAAWIEPSGKVCPDSHPIKAKLSSRIFHLPGMFAYDRTNPDRCYRDEDAAAADGLTRAKR